MNNVCFINPPAPTEGAYLPTGLIRLNGIVKKAGFKTDFIDLEQWRHSGRISFPSNFEASLRRELQHVKAHVFAVTTMSATWPWAALTIRILKETHPDCVLIAGGPQVTLHKGAILKGAPELDIACCGEWEKGIVNLIDSIISTADLVEIPGLFFRRKDRIVSTGDQYLQDDLAQVPVFLPDQTAYYRNVEVLNINAGRGCAYGCRFCSVAAISGKRPRFKSPATLIAETCAYLKSYDLASDILVSYEHDNFLGDLRFLEQFAEQKQKSGLSFSYACSIRLDFLSEIAIQFLAQSGCRVVFIGVESGSQAVQRRCGKNLMVHQVEPIVRRLASQGIIAACNFIVGLPNETLDELYASIELMGSIAKCGGRVGCSIFCPEAGSYYGRTIPPHKWIPVRNSSWYRAMIQAGISPGEHDKELHAFVYTIPNQHYDIELAAAKTFAFAFLLNHFPVSMQHLRLHLKMTWRDVWEELDSMGAYPGQDLVAENLLQSYWEKQVRRARDQYAAACCVWNYDELVATIRGEWTASAEFRYSGGHPSMPATIPAKPVA